SATVAGSRASWRLSYGGLLEQGLTARTELIGPPPLIHRTYVLVVDDPVGIAQEGLGGAIHAEVDAQTALRVLDIELVGIAQLLQPAPSRLAVVLVVDPVNGHPLAGQLVEH